MSLPRTPSFRLDGKRALVAGASSGIGLACAVAYAEAGATVTLLARRQDRLAELGNKIAAEGWSAEILALDIEDTEAVSAALHTRPAYDVFLNAAGIARHSPADETTPQDYDAVFGLNMRAAYFLTQAVARRMIEAGLSGSLINISSQMGHVGGPGRAVYCATKHGIEGMTRAMSLDWAKHGLRVNTLCPTFVLTELTQPFFDDPEIRSWIEGNIPLGRPAGVEDMMGVAVFLASEASAMITGSSILVDGGWTAQ